MSCYKLKMKIMKKYVWLLLALCLPMGFVACSDSDDEPLKPVVKPDDSQEEEEEEKEETSKAYQNEEAYVNFFSFNMMSDIYLWKKEIADALKSWQLLEDPIEAVAKYRYKNRFGEDVDKWTMATDDYQGMVGGTDGEETGTYGCTYKFYLKEAGSDAIVAFVAYTYTDSPAEKAGLKRGDVVLTIDGKPLDKSNYTGLYYNPSVQLGVGHYKGNGVYSDVEKTVQMSAVSMYENPVLMTKVFDCDGKKVGYLHYTSFTFESSLALYEACKQLKAEGISELILDLRYNGGGYVFTENVLASMLAPQDVVGSKAILSTEVWNDDYMEAFKEQGEDLNTYFTTEFKQTHNGKIYDINTADANLNLTKIYALVGEGTASASESVLVCLMPYMEIDVIGTRTHGKYCTGIMWSGEEWYQGVEDNYKENGMNFAKEVPEYADWKKYMTNWGIYIMINMYADKDGNNPCMPSGIKPDVEAVDMIEEIYPLGDEREAMLHLALQRAGKTDLEARTESRSAVSMMPDKEIRLRRHVLEGRRIETRGEVKMPLGINNFGKKIAGTK